MVVIDANLCNACGKCVSICELRDIKIFDSNARPLGISCSECGHCVAVCPQNAIELDGYDRNEIIEYDFDTFKMDPFILNNFMKFRRSTRNYLSKKIENEKINLILEAGRYSPTACNAQNLRYVVIDKEMDIVRDMLWDGAAVYARENEDEFLLSRYREYIDSNKTSDALLYSCSHLIFILSPEENDACIASSRMELMANALGLGALYLGYCKLAVEASGALQEYLKQDESFKTQIVLALGYTGIKWKRTVPRKKANITWK